MKDLVKTKSFCYGCNRQDEFMKPMRMGASHLIFHLHFKGVTPNDVFTKLEFFKLTKNFLRPLYRAFIRNVPM